MREILRLFTKLLLMSFQLGINTLLPMVLSLLFFCCSEPSVHNLLLEGFSILNYFLLELVSLDFEGYFVGISTCFWGRRRSFGSVGISSGSDRPRRKSFIVLFFASKGSNLGIIEVTHCKGRKKVKVYIKKKMNRKWNDEQNKKRLNSKARTRNEKKILTWCI